MTVFVLELYYESESQRALADQVRTAHLTLVGQLAPHLLLEVRVLPATNLERSRPIVAGAQYDVPNQVPSSSAHQSLLITSEDFGLDGLAGPGKGCLNEARLRSKISTGADPANISVHEWLHTLEGQCVRESRIVSPDSSDQHTRFQWPSGRDVDDTDTWHDWYRYLLRE